MLDAANAIAADRAIASVQAAVDRLQAAINGRSSVLAWITGSESSASAQDNSLRVSKEILGQLQDKRPQLDDAGMPGFLGLAAAGGAVQEAVDGAQLQSGAGFVAEVVDPTIASVKQVATVAAFGLGGLLLAALGVVVFVWLLARKS